MIALSRSSLGPAIARILSIRVAGVSIQRASVSVYRESLARTGETGLVDVEPAALAALLPEAVKRVKGTDAAAHARNFFDCVKTRQAPVCNADVMRRSHVVAHAAANSWILGRTLGFDPAAEAFTSGGKPDAEANGLRSRPEREVWA